MHRESSFSYEGSLSGYKISPRFLSWKPQIENHWLTYKRSVGEKHYPGLQNLLWKDEWRIYGCHCEGHFVSFNGRTAAVALKITRLFHCQRLYNVYYLTVLNILLGRHQYIFLGIIKLALYRISLSTYGHVLLPWSAHRSELILCESDSWLKLTAYEFAFTR